MDLESFRRQRRLSQRDVATALGLRSKGYVSDIERGRESCPIKLALQIDDWSNGEVSALSLVDPEDRALLRQFIARAATSPAPRAVRCEVPTIGAHA